MIVVLFISFRQVGILVFNPKYADFYQHININPLGAL